MNVLQNPQGKVRGLSGLPWNNQKNLCVTEHLSRGLLERQWNYQKFNLGLRPQKESQDYQKAIRTNRRHLEQTLSSQEEQDVFTIIMVHPGLLETVHAYMGKLKATTGILGLLLVSRNTMTLYLEDVQICFSTKGDTQVQHK